MTARIIPGQVSRVLGLELEPHQVILTHTVQEEQPAAHVLMFGLLTPKNTTTAENVHGHSNSRTTHDPNRHGPGSKRQRLCWKGRRQSDVWAL